MDLESTHGSFLNGEKVATARYIELKAGDVLRFGTSSREYVLMHNKMKQLKKKGSASAGLQS